jgi:long-chain fatty acid transport protein
MSDAAAFVFGGSDYSVDTETEIRFPAVLTLGYAYKPGPWTVAVDGEWVGYSTVDETSLNFKGETDPNRLAILNTGNPIRRDWKETWNLGLGANYKFNETWQGRLGYMYYPAVIPEHTWDPSIPDADCNAYTSGIGYSINSIVFDFAYAHFSYGNRSIHNQVGINESATTVNGEYKTSADVVSLGITYRF